MTSIESHPATSESQTGGSATPEGFPIPGGSHEGFRAPEAGVAESAGTSEGASAMLRAVLAEKNVSAAWERVRKNHGTAGVDGVTVGLAARKFPAVWREVHDAVLAGTWKARPLRRVEIPKANGKARRLGIPCVMDRVLHTAIAQALSPRWEPRFSPHSFGYRPGKGARDAVRMAQKLINGGLPWVLDLDIENFFDSIEFAGAAPRVTQQFPQGGNGHG